MIKYPSDKMAKDIKACVAEARKSEKVLELRPVVLNLQSANQQDNIALEDIAKLVIEAASANGVPLLLNDIWDTSPQRLQATG